MEQSILAPMKLAYEQNLVVSECGPMAVVGAPGTGKTTTLIEKAAFLVEKKNAAGRVFVATFSWRSHLLAKAALKTRLGERADSVVCGTFRDFAQIAIEQATGQRLNVATFSTIQRTLRAAMAATNFPGTILEAEHIIRHFKAASALPKGEEAYFKLYQTYQNLMEKQGWIDRHDIIRQHILGIRKGHYKPCPIKHLLVNNVQDATHVQLLWMKEHVQHGATLAAFGNDNQTLFSRDGALGAEAFNLLEDIPNIVQYDLMNNFRLPANLTDVVNASIHPIASTRTEPYKATNTHPGTVRFLEHQTLQNELNALVTEISPLTQHGERLAILTYNNAQAHYVERALQKALIPHACFAESVWLTPGANLVMDLLTLLLGEANQNELMNVLAGYGFTYAELTALMQGGLKIETWLEESKNGPLSDELNLKLGQLRQRLSQYMHTMASGSAQAREAFKAAALDLLSHTAAEDREAALLAIDGLTSLKGPLAELIPQLRKRRAPNLNAQVVVAPISEARNMEFNHVYLPFMGQRVWPWGGYQQLGYDVAHDRHQLYMALTRTKKSITLSYTGSPSIFVEELKNVWEGNPIETAA